MIDHGAAATQQFAQDILPLLLLFAISVTGLMLTASYTWMRGYAYEFLAVLHAITVIVTLVWLPFGKLFHIFQRPAQLGVSFYKDAGARGEQARCRPLRERLCPADDGARPGDRRARARVFLRARSRRPLPGRVSEVPARAVRPGTRSVVATIPVDELRIIDRFGPHLSGDDRCAAIDERRARAARQDALLFLRPAVRHPAQGPRQRSDWLRAVGRVSLQPRHAVPEGREALPAGLASRSPARPLCSAIRRRPAGLRRCRTMPRSRGSPPRSRGCSRRTARARSASSAAPA